MARRADLECVTVELGPEVFLHTISALSPRAATTSSIVLPVLPGQKLIDLRTGALSGLHLNEDDVGKLEELGFIAPINSEPLPDDLAVDSCPYEKLLLKRVRLSLTTFLLISNQKKELISKRYDFKVDISSTVVQVKESLCRYWSESGETPTIQPTTHELYLPPIRRSISVASNDKHSIASLQATGGMVLENSRLLVSYRLKSDDVVVLRTSEGFSLNNRWKAMSGSNLLLSITSKELGLQKTLMVEPLSTVGQALKQFLEKINAPRTATSPVYGLFTGTKILDPAQRFIDYDFNHEVKLELVCMDLDKASKTLATAKRVFGVDPAHLTMSWDDDDDFAKLGPQLIVPDVLSTLMRLFVDANGLQTPGIFFTRGSEAEIGEVQGLMDFGITVRNDYTRNPHNIADLIKRWFTCLPRKLLATLSITPQMVEDDDQLIRIPETLGKPYGAMFSWLIRLLAIVSKHSSRNKTELRSLTTTWGPIVLPDDKGDIKALLSNAKLGATLLEKSVQIWLREYGNLVVAPPPLLEDSLQAKRKGSAPVPVAKPLPKPKFTKRATTQFASAPTASEEAPSKAFSESDVDGASPRNGLPKEPSPRAKVSPKSLVSSTPKGATGLGALNINITPRTQEQIEADSAAVKVSPRRPPRPAFLAPTYIPTAEEVQQLVIPEPDFPLPTLRPSPFLLNQGGSFFDHERRKRRQQILADPSSQKVPHTRTLLKLPLNVVHTRNPSTPRHRVTIIGSLVEPSSFELFLQSYTKEVQEIQKQHKAYREILRWDDDLPFAEVLSTRTAIPKPTPKSAPTPSHAPSSSSPSSAPKQALVTPTPKGSSPSSSPSTSVSPSSSSSLQPRKQEIPTLQTTQMTSMNDLASPKSSSSSPHDMISPKGGSGSGTKDKTTPRRSTISKSGGRIISSIFGFSSSSSSSVSPSSSPPVVSSPISTVQAPTPTPAPAPTPTPTQAATPPEVKKMISQGAIRALPSFVPPLSSPPPPGRVQPPSQQQQQQQQQPETPISPRGQPRSKVPLGMVAKRLGAPPPAPPPKV